VTEPLAYLDSSAIVKLVFTEPESGVLKAFLAESHGGVSSILARIELARVAQRLGQSRAVGDSLATILRRIAFLPLSDAIVIAAGELEPASLRTLDAIHLATALSVREALAGVVTYDRRLAEAARRAGLTVWSPR
jgi:predicted nucleic acid-binding protein